MPSISCSALTFTWPDGSSVIADVDLAVGPGVTGLVGANGSGKTTLLRLILGSLVPTSGSVSVDGRVAHLPQRITLATDRTVDDVLGVAEQRRALRAVESGDVTAAHLDTIGDDWDVEERALTTLHRLGLTDVGLDRTVGTLSGGETMMVALAELLLDPPDVLLLDEPTNNLDRRRRADLLDAIDAFGGVLVVVSHDRGLLERVDDIVELHGGSARSFGGPLSVYEQVLDDEQRAAHARVRSARADLRRQQRERAEAQTKLDRRARGGRAVAAAGGMPRSAIGARKRRAQRTAGRERGVHDDRIAEAQRDLDDARSGVRDDDDITVDLTATAVPSKRVVLDCRDLQAVVAGADGDRRLWSHPVDLQVRGPERVAMLGPNGVGKTTLLRMLAGLEQPSQGTVAVCVDGVGYLAQRLDHLDDEASLLDELRRAAPGASDNELRARLAGFGFRGRRVDQPVSGLSGGERFRAVLAGLLLAQPPPQLLLLDEPTNNLDVRSVRQLERALVGYGGAVVVASHDDAFLAAVGVDRWLHLDPATGLRQVGPPTQ